MAITANTETVEVKVELKYDKASGDKAAKQVADFQRKQEQKDAAHKKSLEQAEEKHQQKMRQAQEMAFKKAELRIATSQKKIADGTKSWSQRMTDATERVNTSLKAMAIAFVSTQLVQGIKNLATQALTMAADLKGTADMIGVTTEFLAKMQVALDITGTDLGRFANSMTVVAAKLDDARQGSEQAQKAFERLGINWQDASLENVVEQLLEAAKNTANLGAVTNVVGNKMGAVYADLGQEMERSKATIADMAPEIARAAEQSDEFLNRWKALKSQFSLKIAASLAPGLNQAMPAITEMFNSMARSISQINFNALISTIVKLTSVLGKMGSTFAENSAGFALLGTPAIGAAAGGFALRSNYVRKLPKVTGGRSAADQVIAALKKVDISKIVASAQNARAITATTTALTKFVALIGKAAWVLTAFLALWDFSKARAAGLGFFASVGYAVTQFIESLTFGLVKFDHFKKKIRELEEEKASINSFADAVERFKGILGDKDIQDKAQPKLKEDLKALEQEAEGRLKILKIYKDRAETQGDNINRDLFVQRLSEYEDLLLRIEKHKALIRPDGGGIPKIVTPKELTDLEKFRVEQEANNRALKDYLKLLDTGKITLKEFLALAPNAEDVLAVKNVFGLRGPSVSDKPTAPNPDAFATKMRGILQTTDLGTQGQSIGSVAASLAEESARVKEVTAALYDYAKANKLSATETQKLASALSVDIPQSISGVEIASQALYNVGNAMQSLIQVQQNLRDKDAEEHQRKMERLNAELDALREQGFQYTEFYRNKEKLANQENKEHVKTMTRMFKFQRAVNTITAVMDSYLGFNSVMKDSTLPTLARLVIAPSVLAMGLANAYAIASQPTPKFATGGRIQGNPYQDNTAVLAQGGEYITNQRATRRNLRTLESINNGVNMDGGAGISVNITGNVIGSREFVRDTLVPEIRKALRDGYTIA